MTEEGAKEQDCIGPENCGQRIGPVPAPVVAADAKWAWPFVYLTDWCSHFAQREA